MKRLLRLCALLALGACSPAKPADDASGTTPAGSDSAKPTGSGPAATTPDVAATPEKTPPAGLSDSEEKELAATCAPLVTAMIEADAAAVRALDDALQQNPKATDADDKALAVALAKAKASTAMSGGDLGRCVALFEKQEKKKLFEHEPAEDEARSVVDSCVKRAEAVYGKETMAFDMSGGNAPKTGPFCPDDFPVPLHMSQLPYKSSAEDWAGSTWKCLVFGLRAEQHVQLEYNAPVHKGEFTCIARYVPRQGGAPVEVFRGGKQGEKGELLIMPKMMRRRMKLKG